MVGLTGDTSPADERAAGRKRNWRRTATWLLALGASSAAVAACSNQGRTQNPLALGSAGAAVALAPSGPAAGGGVSIGATGAAGQSTLSADAVEAAAGGGGVVPIGVAGSAATAGSAAAAGSTGLSGSMSAAGMTGTTGSGGGGAGGASESPVSTCVKALKPKCQMRDTSACSSYLTVDVGTLVKGAEFQFGPYGAIMEYNIGKGFEVPKNASEDGCATVDASFGEPKNVTDDTADLKDVDLTLYTAYRPACMAEGETYPVITWGNGTCGQTESYGALLRYIASYGYVVFASNSRYTGSNGAMTKALDFAASANKDPTSHYYNRLDMTKIGAMGHSQGGSATVTAASDARISSLIIWNASTSAVKPFLSISGDSDIDRKSVV
jgi:hypothetical protein